MHIIYILLLYIYILYAISNQSNSQTTSRCLQENIPKWWAYDWLVHITQFPSFNVKDQKGNGSCECQDRPVLRSSENPSQDVGTVKDCKVQKQWAVLCDSHWPQKNSAEAMKVQQSINSILPTLLDRRLLDFECELLPSCITYQDFPSLPKISVQSASRKSYRARRSTNFNQSSTLGLTILKRKKGNHWESHKNDRNIMPSWLDSAPRLETFHIEARWSRKEKKETCQTKRKLEKTKGTRSRKRKRRKKKQQIEEKGNKRNSEQDLTWFVI